jgi:hypothetical protein
MFIAMNSIRVAKGSEADFVCLSRDTHFECARLCRVSPCRKLKITLTMPRTRGGKTAQCLKPGPNRAFRAGHSRAEANDDIFAADAGPAVGRAAGLRELAGRKRT